MQDNYIKKRKKGKHLSLTERGMIEAFLKVGLSHKEIAKQIGVSTKTIQREKKRGMAELLNSDLEYVADIAHDKHKKNQSRKKGRLRLERKESWRKKSNA